MSDVKFQVGDKVRWGTAEGAVETLTVDSSIVVNFKGRRLWFKADCSIFSELPGQPLLELIERPKKTRKVKLWRWEARPHFDQRDGWRTRQTTGWSEKCVNPDWTKVPGSEREIEVTEEE